MQVLFSFFFFAFPFLFFKGFYEHSEFPKIIFVYFAVTILLLVYLFNNWQKKNSLSLSSLDILVFLYALLATISTVFARNQNYALFGYYPYTNQSLFFIYYLTICYFLFKTLFEAPSRERNPSEAKLSLAKGDNIYIKSFVISSVAGLTINAAYGISAYLIQWFKTYDPTLRAIGAEQNPILFGVLMLIGFWLSIYAKRETQKEKQFSNLAFYILPVAFLLGILFSYSRGVWISFFVSIAIFFLSNIRSVRRPNYKLLLLPTIALAVLGITFYVPVKARIDSLSEQSPLTSKNIRLLELKDAFKLAREESLPFGIGPANLLLAYPQYRAIEHNLTQEWNKYPIQIRNNYLDIFIALGPLGLAVFLLLALFLLKKADNIPITSLAIALLIYGVFNYYGTTTLVYFWTLLALARASGNNKEIISIDAKLFNFARIPLILLCFAALFIVFRTIKAELLFSQGLRIYNNISYIQKYKEESGNILFTNYQFKPQDSLIALSALEQFVKAKDTLVFSNPVYIRQLAHTLALSAVLSDNSREKERIYKEAYDTISLQINNSEDYLNYRIRSSISFRAFLDNINPKFYVQQAKVDNQTVIAYDPANPLNYDNFGLLLRETGDLEKAKIMFEKAITLKPDFLQSKIHLEETLEISKEAK